MAAMETNAKLGSSASFESRMGLPTPVVPILRQETSSALRTAIWNWLFLNFWERGIGYEAYATRSRSRISAVCKEIWYRLLNLDVATMGHISPAVTDSRAYKGLKAFVIDGAWWAPYKIVEAITDLANTPQDKIDELNAQLKKHGSAYQMLSGKFVEITDQVQIDAITNALSIGSLAEQTHLKRALALISDMQNPDYRNSVKESISAVEAACRAATNKPSATLGDALKRITQLHPVLADAFRKLYGYTSDESGIRHSLSGDDKVTHADAMFMLIACSAFIGYLKATLASEVP